MNIILLFLAEFVFISFVILFLFSLRKKLGLAPLYIFIGSVQYLQTLLSTAFYITFFDTYSISPGSVLLFSSSLFTVLLVYIKEGIPSSRTLIFGIVFANVMLSLIAGITNIEASGNVTIIHTTNAAFQFFKFDYRVFTIGTITLLIDFLLIIIIYKFLFTKARSQNLFAAIFFSLLLTLWFDALVFTTASFYNRPNYQNILVSQLIGKSIAAFVFAVILFIYAKYLDAGKIKNVDFIADKDEDIFSIIRYRNKYQALKIEKEITEKELSSRLEQTLNTMSDAFVSLDKNWCYTYLNKKAGEIFNRGPESLIGKHIWTEFPEGVGQPVYKAYEKAMAEQHYVYLQEYYPSFDRWFDSHIYPSAYGISIFLKDITETKKIQNALISNEKKYRKLVESITDGFMSLDKDWNYTYVNNKAAEILGRNAADLIGKQIWKEVPEVVGHPFQLAYEKAIATQQYIYLEEYYPPNELWLENHIYPSADGLSIFFRDITERKKIGDRFQFLVSATPAIIYSSQATPPFNTTFISDNIYLQTGYLANEFTENASFRIDHVHPDDKQRVLNNLQHFFETGFHHHEYRFLMKDGNYRWMHDEMKLVYDQISGKAIEIVGYWIDINERKIAEEKIIESEEKYRSLINQASDAIILYNREGKFIEVNSSAEKISGYTKQEMEKFSVFDLMEPENLKNNPLQFEELLKGKSVTTERIFIRKNGTLINVEISSKLLHNGYFQAIARDITERKKTEQALIESEEMYRSLIENLPDIIMRLDLDENVQFINFTEGGYTKEQIIGTSAYNFVTPEFHDVVRETHKKIIATKTSQSYETVAMGLDGIKRWFLTNVGPIIIDGKVTGITLITRDISNRKKAEQALEERERHLQTILQTEPECIKQLGPNGELYDMNPAGLAMIEADNLAIVKNKSLLEILLPQYRMAFLNLTKEVFKGNSGKLEFEIKGLKGTQRWLETHAVPLRNVAGEIISLLGVTRDVTERRNAEQLLRGEKKVMEMITDNMPLHDILTSIALNYEDHANGGLCSILLLDDDGIHLRHGAAPNLPKTFNRSIDGELIGENAGSCGTAVFRKKTVIVTDINTDPLWTNYKEIALQHGLQSCWSVPIISQTKNVLGTFAIYYKRISSPNLKDIEFIERATNLAKIAIEKNHDAAILKNSEEKYRNMVERNLAGIYQSTINGKILACNNAFARMMGYNSQQEVLKKGSLALYFSDTERDFFISSLRRMGGELNNFETTLKHKDGRIVHVTENCFLRKDSLTGKEIIEGAMIDITERKKIKEQIIKEKELSDSIINSLPGIFYLFDANRNLIRWNKNFEIISGYNATEIIKVKPIDFYEGEGRTLVQENFAKTLQEGKAQFEANFVTKAGEKILYYFTGLLVDYEGKPCILGTGIDISLRKKAEEEIKIINEQLRQLTQHLQNIREEERKRISREIHDDLGQQLTAIKMDVAWIDKKTTGESVAVKSKLKNIISLLDSSNVSVRRILNELRTDILDNYGLIEALEWQGRKFTANTEIPLLFTSTETVLKTDGAIATCIFRTFQEALTNITRYAQAQQVKSSLTRTGDNILFTVEDNGKGFDATRVNNRKSFGILGMKERVASLNGDFKLISSPGKGTKIIISIPFK